MKTLNKRTLIIVIGFTLMHFMGISQTTHTVSVVNTEFVPEMLEIQAGDTVTWNNTSGFHNVNGTQSTYPSNPQSFGNSTGSNWTYTYIFDTPGTYNYQCDPHVNLGMTGTVTVIEEAVITVSFTEMTPHIGQMLELYVYDIESDSYIDTLLISTIEGSDFELMTENAATGASYNLDFFADLNGNSMYDSPPTDHAWRMVLKNIEGDTTIEFVHNVEFTDIFESNEPTGLEMPAITKDAILYPLPANDDYISLNKRFSQETVVTKILNINGQVVVGPQKISISKNQLKLYIEDLPKGIYFLEVSEGKDKNVYKFVKSVE